VQPEQSADLQEAKQSQQSYGSEKEAVDENAIL
jgi:hypothetical protein